MNPIPTAQNTNEVPNNSITLFNISRTDIDHKAHLNTTIDY